MNLKITTDIGEFSFNMDTKSAQEVLDIAFQKAAGAKPTQESAGMIAKGPHIMAEGTAIKQGIDAGRKANEGKPKSRVEAMFGNRENWNTPAAPKTSAQQKNTPRAVTFSADGYKGFLWIKCHSCGRVKGFCARQPMTTFVCKECGKSTALVDLRIAHVRCGCCDKKYDYKTNITEEQFSIPCFNCDAPVDMELNHAGTTYVVMGRPV